MSNTTKKRKRRSAIDVRLERIEDKLTILIQQHAIRHQQKLAEYQFEDNKGENASVEQ